MKELPNSKVCNVCGRELPLSAFYFRNGRPMPTCRECRIAHQRDMRDMAKGKVCPHCGRRLPASAYYSAKRKRGTALSYACKECICSERRALYLQRKPHHDGVFMGKRDGRLYQRRNGHVSVLWTDPMIEQFRRLFPVTPNSDIRDMFGMSQSMITRKARELGLRKNRKWIHDIRMNLLRTARIMSRYSKKKKQ